MSDKSLSEISKSVIDVLIGFERLQFSSKSHAFDVSDAVYFLYSSVIKLIYKVVDPEKRNYRIFRLKYHHILTNESVDEYLFHCLSKILSDILECESNYHNYIQPVADLHVKLMSILSKIQQNHEKIVLDNKRVKSEILKYQESSKPWKTLLNDSNETNFVPVYYLPSHRTSGKLRKAQHLTFQAINSYYTSGNSQLDPETVEMLLDFDNTFAFFELDFVCKVNSSSILSPCAAELTMEIAVMFAEAVRWAHDKNLLKYSAIADCDIEIMLGIPRLSVLYGCGIAEQGPLSEWSLNCRSSQIEERLAPVFLDHHQQLSRLRRQLNVLNSIELTFLSNLLVNHEDLPPEMFIPSSRKSLPKSKSFNKSPLSGDIHALFKLIAFVSDQMQTKHASDYRFFMELMYKLYKDEKDDDESPKSSRCLRTQSLKFQNPLLNSFIFDEAVDALSYHIPENNSESCLSELPFRSHLTVKSFHSSIPSKLQHSVQNQENEYTSTVINFTFDRPQWQSDSTFSRCCHCSSSFNLFRRRHHCRRCGYLFCNSCWGTKVPLPSLGIHTSVPICVECEEFLFRPAVSPTQSSS